MLESVIVLVLMAILLIGSPGPAAMALAATGSSYKFKQGLPLISGLVTGVLLTGLLTNAGILAVFSHWPKAKIAMQISGAIYILIIAVRMLQLPIATQCEQTHPYFGFRSGILMNILNPKAYVVFMLLISNFMPPMPSDVLAFVLLESVALVATLIVTFGWLLFGAVLGKYIKTARGKQKMQVVFSCLMIIFIFPVLTSIPL